MTHSFIQEPAKTDPGEAPDDSDLGAHFGRPQPPDQDEESTTSTVDEEALKMRELGLNYRQIADRQQIATSTAFRRVQNGLEQQRQEAREAFDTIRELDLLRLQWIERRLMAETVRGDRISARLLLQVMRYRRVLLEERESSETIDPWTATVGSDDSLLGLAGMPDLPSNLDWLSTLGTAAAPQTSFDSRAPSEKASALADPLTTLRNMLRTARESDETSEEQPRNKSGTIPEQNGTKKAARAQHLVGGQNATTRCCARAAKKCFCRRAKSILYGKSTFTEFRTGCQG